MTSILKPNKDHTDQPRPIRQPSNRTISESSIWLADCDGLSVFESEYLMGRRIWVRIGTILSEALYPEEGAQPPVLRNTASCSLLMTKRFLPEHHRDVFAAVSQCHSEMGEKKWIGVSDVVWHSPESDFKGNAQGIYHWRELRNDKFKITEVFSRGEWVSEIIYKM